MPFAVITPNPWKNLSSTPCCAWLLECTRHNFGETSITTTFNRKGVVDMKKPLEKEFQFYLDHQDELVKGYDGKYIVIKNGEVLGAYDSDLEALEKTSKEHELGTFLIQKCEPGTESYSTTFHSRVAFG